MNKVLEAARVIAEVTRRLPKLGQKITQAAFWKKGTAIVLDAITASEIGRKDKEKFFEWLVWSPNRKYGPAVREKSNRIVSVTYADPTAMIIGALKVSQTLRRRVRLTRSWETPGLRLVV